MMGQIGDPERFPVSWKRCNDVPGALAPGLLQQALKTQLKSRFEKVVMDDKGGARSRNVAISHHGFSAFVSANGRPGQFQPHLQEWLVATVPLGWKQAQAKPLVDEPGCVVRSGQVQGECLRAVGRAAAAFPGVWFPGQAPFSQIPLLAEYAGGLPSSSCLPLSLALYRSFALLALPTPAPRSPPTPCTRLG